MLFATVANLDQVKAGILRRHAFGKLIPMQNLDWRPAGEQAIGHRRTQNFDANTAILGAFIGFFFA